MALAGLRPDQADPHRGRMELLAVLFHDQPWRAVFRDDVSLGCRHQVALSLLLHARLDPRRQPACRIVHVGRSRLLWGTYRRQASLRRPVLEFLAHGASSPGSSAYCQAYLWTLNTIGQTGLGSGISAFPSVHVALATLNALFAREYSRRLGIVAFAYAALIEVSSVYLGWHYAIDGYAAAIATVLIYVATRRMVPAGRTRAMHLPQWARPAPVAAAVAITTAS